MTTPTPSRIFLAVLCTLASGPAAEAGRMISPAPPAAVTQSAVPHQWLYPGEKGVTFEAPGGYPSLWIGLRFQVRYTTLNQISIVPSPGSGDVSLEGDDEVLPTAASLRAGSSEASLNRSRVKGGGALFPWLDVYSEVSLKRARWLDYRGTVKLADWLKIRGGQWKSEFNRERVDSSGKQQFADRSIANAWFTLDRQQGLSVFGRIGAEQPYDSSYWIEMLSGAGLGGTWNGGDRLWLARWQWNPFGRELAFSQSDIARRKDPAAAVALAFVGGDSRFTRWASSGGGQLPGYDGGSPGRSRIRQAMFETACQHRGLSWQQELHWKQVRDRTARSTRRLWGTYAQAGCFPHEFLPLVPSPFEIAGRFALVDPDTARTSDRLREWSLALNWFFHGHRNKLTADLSRLTAGEGAAGGISETRFRLQWDVSF